MQSTECDTKLRYAFQGSPPPTLRGVGQGRRLPPALQEPPRPAHTTPAPRPPLVVEVPSPDQALKVPQAFSPGRPSPPSPLKKILKLSVGLSRLCECAGEERGRDL